MPSVTFLGIGNMGAALAKTLLKTTSHKVTIWNRTVDRSLVKEVVNAGASLEPSIEAALSSDIIVVCVLDYDSIYRALEPISSSSSSLANKVIINLTNGTPRQAGELQEWIKARGATYYFDGAVMVTPQLVGTEHSFILYCGENEERFNEHVADLVKPLGLPLYTGDDIRSAATDDLAALSTMYGMFAGFFSGLGLMRKQLGEGGKVAPSVGKVVVPLMNALVPYLSHIADTIDKEDWENNLGNPLGMQVAGMQNILQAYREQSVNGAALAAFLKLMERAVSERGGDVGIPAVALHLSDKE